ncbi:MAG: helix-turn-helix transcriptional regulator [Cyanobacteria bacterium]|nr:helix-turn-helix transcriptional regulator [Cyanobacteriota bacterium]
MNKTIYSNDYNFLTKQLKSARLESGLNQVEIAKLLGKTQSYISKIESGQLRIDIIQLKELAKLYKKDINYFLK